LHAALRTVFEKHFSTSNTTPASLDVTALAIIKPKKHQRLFRSTVAVWCRNS